MMKNIVKSRKAGILMIVLGSVICICTLLPILILNNGINLTVNYVVGFVIWISFAIYYIIAGIANISKPCLQKPTKIISVIVIVLSAIGFLAGLVLLVMAFVRGGAGLFYHVLYVVAFSISIVYDVSLLLLACHILRQLSLLSGKRKTDYYQNGVLFSSDFHYLAVDNTKTETEPFSYLH